MPESWKILFVCLLPAFISVVIPATPALILASEGIDTYYIRYDVQSSRNTIIKDNLLMFPAKNDFRAENFSQIIIAGAISAVPNESELFIEQRIKENALKSILEKYGLRSIKTKDRDTIVSYEGMVVTPLQILKKTYNESQNSYVYEVEMEFSPLAFPDRWEALELKDKFKKILSGFFEFFK